MGACPFNSQDLYRQGNLYYQSIAVSFHIKDDYVVGQNAGRWISSLEVIQRIPSPPIDVRNPIFNPRPAFRMLLTEVI